MSRMGKYELPSDIDPQTTHCQYFVVLFILKWLDNNRKKDVEVKTWME